jgi:hypothetical protein
MILELSATWSMDSRPLALNVPLRGRSEAPRSTGKCSVYALSAVPFSLIRDKP